MPGYYVHLAVSNPKSKKNRSFVCGIEAPDLLKNYFKLYGLNGARKKYDSIKTIEMPDFSCFESRIQQKESNLSREGMHYGCSSNPDVIYFWNSLTNEERKNPFYVGYLWHLLTDLIMYKYLNIEKKFSDFAKQHQKDENLCELQKIEINKLHSDWDKTNAKIRSTYPDVILTPEIIELNVVKFINDNQLAYVHWNIIKSLTDYMRTINPLTQNINGIIDEIISFLPEQNDYSIDALNMKLSLSKFKNKKEEYN